MRGGSDTKDSHSFGDSVACLTKIQGKRFVVLVALVASFGSSPHNVRAQGNVLVDLLALEVTQAVQNMNGANPWDPAINNNVPLIAGKTTVVRAYFSQRVADPELTFRGELEVRKPDGTSLTQASTNLLSPETSLEKWSYLRRNLDDSLNFVLTDLDAPGDYTFTVKGITYVYTGGAGVTGRLQCSNCGQNVTVKFLLSSSLKVKFVRLREKVNGVISRATPTHAEFVSHVQYIKSWLKRSFPISREGLQVTQWQWPDDAVLAQLRQIDPANAWAEPEYNFEDCGSVAAAILDAREALKALERTAFDGKVLYVGLFGNMKRVDSNGNTTHLGGCAYPDPDEPYESQVVVPLGTPGSWKLMAWDKDGSYSDWYTGHELGHVFGLYHLPYSAIRGDCYPPSNPVKQGCPRGPYDPFFKQGLISESDGAYVGFDVGDRPGMLALPMGPLPGSSWHDMMTYSKFVWVSNRDGVDGNGLPQDGRSYDWIRRGLMSANSGSSGSFAGPSGLMVGGEGSSGPSATAEPLVHTPGSLRVVAVVNLTKKKAEFRLVRRVEGVAALSGPKKSETLILLKDKVGAVIGTPAPVALRHNADALKDVDEIALVSVTIPLPPDKDLTNVDRLELVDKGAPVATLRVSYEELRSGSTKTLGLLANPPKPKQ